MMTSVVHATQLFAYENEKLIILRGGGSASKSFGGQEQQFEGASNVKIEEGDEKQVPKDLACSCKYTDDLKTQKTCYCYVNKESEEKPIEKKAVNIGPDVKYGYMIAGGMLLMAIGTIVYCEVNKPR